MTADSPTLTGQRPRFMLWTHRRPRRQAIRPNVQRHGSLPRAGWQLEDQIRISELGFGRDDARVLDTLEVVATWLGSLFPWVG
jgi:hypothetical protein